MPTIAVILAAGQGTRMKSTLPKVLHPLLGQPMIAYVVQALEAAGSDEILAVLGHGAGQVAEALGGRIKPVYQEEQLGTGHALLMALPQLLPYGEGRCLVVCGDTPLLQGETLGALRRHHEETGAKAVLLTAMYDDPRGYGRILRQGEQIMAIVEEKDATAEQKEIKEINAGAYCFDLLWLKQALAQLVPANAQGEYYLTDVVGYLAAQGQKVVALQAPAAETMGINTRLQLSQAQDYLRRSILEKHMLAGVTVEDVSSTFVGPLVDIGRDTVLEPGVQLLGQTIVEEDCRIGPRSRISDCRIGAGTTVNQSTLEGCRIGPRCQIGPYTYLRPGCVLEEKVKVGGFVEMKKVTAAAGAKIPHLSYIGDTTIGCRVNVGAGTITCNYDGKTKHPTVLGDDVFVGSNTNLVAPVEVGEGAFIAAGSTITQNVPPGALAVAREKQRNVLDWDRKGK